MSALTVGKRVASWTGRNAARMNNKGTRKMLALAGFGLVAGHGLNRGANTDGATTNAILDNVLGSSDIDNSVFGEDIGLLTDLKYKHLGGAVKTLGVGGGIFAGIGGAAVGSIPGIAMAKKAKNPLVKSFGVGLAGLGALSGGGVGYTAGHMAGSAALLVPYARGPIGKEYVSRQNASMYMPAVDGSVVFGAYNQRRA